MLEGAQIYECNADSGANASTPVCRCVIGMA
jgi:hypothetical protein